VSVPGLFPEFSPSVSAIVNDLSEQLKRNPRQPLEFKLSALAMLVSRHITAISDLRAAANKPLPANKYLSVLPFVDYNLDGMLKIGQVQLAASPKHMEEGAVVTSVQNVSVGDRLTHALAGKWETPKKILNDPASRPHDELLTRLKASLVSDGGASLTLDEMRGIASSLAGCTAQSAANASEVWFARYGE
jgi:hypothetical protein